MSRRSSNRRNGWPTANFILPPNVGRRELATSPHRYQAVGTELCIWEDRAMRLAGKVALVTGGARSEEHTSELQSHLNLVCRLLLEKKKEYGQKSTAVVPDRHAAHS